MYVYVYIYISLSLCLSLSLSHVCIWLAVCGSSIEVYGSFIGYLVHCSICACHPGEGAMLILSVAFQFYRKISEGNRRSRARISPATEVADMKRAAISGGMTTVKETLPAPAKATDNCCRFSC